MTIGSVLLWLMLGGLAFLLGSVLIALAWDGIRALLDRLDAKGGEFSLPGVGREKPSLDTIVGFGLLATVTALLLWAAFIGIDVPVDSANNVVLDILREIAVEILIGAGLLGALWKYVRRSHNGRGSESIGEQQRKENRRLPRAGGWE